jgi:outer membrane protein W
VLCLLWLCLPAVAGAQEASVVSPWKVHMRLAVSGDSHSSEPQGYTVYSGIALGGAFTRDVQGPRVSTEVSFALESREVNGPGPTDDERLGSLEMLPVNLTIRWRPRQNRDAGFQPYVGGGLNVTTTSEKSGALDSTDVPVSVGPVVQLGLDIAVSRRALVNIDAKWNTLSATIERFRGGEPSVHIDPMTLAFGVAVGF